MLPEILFGASLFVGYYVVAASSLILIRLRLGASGELFRKMLHMACVLSIFVLLYAFETWYASALTALVFAAVVYPAIAWIERYPKVMELLTQRKSGEIRHSLLLVFGMMAALITVFWGILGPQWKYIILVAVLAWGLGDAAAALAGTRFGKRHILLPLVDPNKTAEGSLAMFGISFLSSFACLTALSGAPWVWCLACAGAVALVSSAVELISRGGVDTVTVPVAASVAAYGVMYLSMWMGGAL